jgi:hypothetical protein
LYKRPDKILFDNGLADFPNGGILRFVKEFPLEEGGGGGKANICFPNRLILGV